MLFIALVPLVLPLLLFDKVCFVFAVRLLYFVQPTNLSE